MVVDANGITGPRSRPLCKAVSQPQKSPLQTCNPRPHASIPTTPKPHTSTPSFNLNQRQNVRHSTASERSTARCCRCTRSTTGAEGLLTIGFSTVYLLVEHGLSLSISFLFPTYLQPCNLQLFSFFYFFFGFGIGFPFAFNKDQTQYPTNHDCYKMITRFSTTTLLSTNIEPTTHFVVES